MELLRGQYARADAWLIRAAELADPDGEERAWILAVHGASQTDTGDHTGARDRLREGADLAHAA